MEASDWLRTELNVVITFVCGRSTEDQWAKPTWFTCVDHHAHCLGWPIGLLQSSSLNSNAKTICQPRCQISLLISICLVVKTLMTGLTINKMINKMLSIPDTLQSMTMNWTSWRDPEMKRGPSNKPIGVCGFLRVGVNRWPFVMILKPWQNRNSIKHSGVFMLQSGMPKVSRMLWVVIQVSVRELTDILMTHLFRVAGVWSPIANSAAAMVCSSQWWKAAQGRNGHCHPPPIHFRHRLC